GSDLMDELDLDVGDDLSLDDADRPLRIVGRAVFATVQDNNALATGLGFTLTSLEGLITDLGGDPGSDSFLATPITVAPGADLDALEAEVGEEFAGARQGIRPAAVENLTEATNVPTLLAAFLALLGVLGI